MATCSEWYCSPNACDNFDFFDALKGSSVEEDIDSAGSPPGAPGIKIGTVSFKVEAYVFTDFLKATRTGSSVSPTITVTKPIPGEVITEALKYIQDHGAGWLAGASTEDAKAKVVSQCGDGDWQQLLEAAIGLKGKGAYLPKGSSYGKPVWTKSTTITYYTDGHLEGCELGSSDAYAADGYPCGKGSFEINGNLLWERPSNPSLFSKSAFSPIFNPCLTFCGGGGGGPGGGPS